MASVHLVSTSPRPFESAHQDFRPLRPSAVRPVQLMVMDTVNQPLTTPDETEPVMTLSQLADRLCVPVKTLYDLRSKARGPRGFRVGRQLRFRRREVDAWLTQLESADAPALAQGVGMSGGRPRTSIGTTDESRSPSGHSCRRARKCTSATPGRHQKETSSQDLARGARGSR